MGKSKTQKIQELGSFSNLYQRTGYTTPGLLAPNGEIVDPKGKWKELAFPFPQPITLELACGRGEYALALAAMYPKRNFIGADLKGARLWKACNSALAQNLENVIFLRIQIERLEAYFAPNEVEEIWITFPDPFPTNRRAKHRLTHPKFLERYKKALRAGGVIHLKTDCSLLFDFTLQTIEQLNLPVVRIVHDVYADAPGDAELSISTWFERQHLAQGRTIKYVSFRLD